MAVEQSTVTTVSNSPAATPKFEQRKTNSAPIEVTTRVVPMKPAPEPKLFAEALLELSPTRPKSNGKRVFYSVLIHTLVLLALILPPLYFTDTINFKQFTQTMLVAPPPPPPPPPAPQALVKAVPPKHVFTNAGKLVAPTVIPQKIAMIKEEQLEPDLGGVAGGVPGGVPGGQMGGVLGGIISDASRKTAIAPAPVQNKTPLRVGGRIKPPRILSRINPNYPPLARQTRIQGDVVLDAVIDTEGNVVQLQVVSGHALLIQAALEAVKQWKYEPTYLNEQAIPVQLIVNVTFRLEQQ
ncbi:MAG TPA: TonB family protein [Candidatus Acidoferrum sp.]|nr:TonB family protein [Candidatus Acidoferrum sp.]